MLILKRDEKKKSSAQHRGNMLGLFIGKTQFMFVHDRREHVIRFQNNKRKQAYLSNTDKNQLVISTKNIPCNERHRVSKKSQYLHEVTSAALFGLFLK